LSDRFLDQPATKREHTAMSSKRPINRKQFLTLTVSTVAASTLAACGEDTPAPAGGSGSGTGGTTGGTPPAGGTPGVSGGGAGGSASGSGGTPGAGTGGGGSSSGGGGAGGMSGSGGAGGASGGAGGGGGAGGSGGGMCGTAKVMQTSQGQHDHIPMDPAQFLMDLKNHINGATATMMFTLPAEGQTPHTHTITLTAMQVMTLKSGGMVTGVESSEGDDHSHEYTISCMA
jgi:hypothetical protein